MTHRYRSTACFHTECSDCRKTCKFCDAPCECSCHLTPPSMPGMSVSAVTQARTIARELLDSATTGTIPAELAMRIATDPDLFWLRDGETPSGTWWGPR